MRVARWLVVVACTLAAACRGGPNVAPLPSPQLADGEYLKALHMMVPVVGVRPERVQNTFDAARGTAGERDHKAIDILASKGTPVVAATDGEILRVTNNALGGKTIYATDRGRRFVYYYAHLDKYAKQTKVGLQVKQGTVIGYVGTTGNAPKNIPHLHFQVMRMKDSRQWWEGPPINPFGTFARAGAVE